MNMQKTAVFGGKRRVRISSQSLKRTMRTSQYYMDNIGHPSTRTRLIVNNIAERLSINVTGADVGKVENVALMLAGAIEGAKTITTKKRSENGKIETQVLPYTAGEIERLEEIFSEVLEMPDSKAKEKKSIINFIEHEIGKLDETAKQNMAIDMALSGRMATAKKMERLDASFALAHAITTHTVSGDIDWFTAVDDLIVDSGETGSGHLATQEFSAGVFYRYGSLNIRQLQDNLGDASRAVALDLARHLLHLLCTEVPAAKQNSFAAFNHADFAFVSFGDMPISLANAFEEPVEQARKGGFLLPSIAKFCSYQKKMYEGYSIDDKIAWFSLQECELAEGQKKSLADLEQWVSQDAGQAND
jgi:CRISPR system Cascade subunit CasC